MLSSTGKAPQPTMERISNDLGNEPVPVPPPTHDEKSELPKLLNSLLDAFTLFPEAQKIETIERVEALPASSRADADEQEIPEDTTAADTATLADTQQYQATETEVQRAMHERASAEDVALMKSILQCMSAGSEALRTTVLPDQVVKEVSAPGTAKSQAPSSKNLADAKIVTVTLLKELREASTHDASSAGIFEKSSAFLQYQLELINIRIKQLDAYTSPHSRSELVDQQILMIDIAQLVAVKIRDSHLPAYKNLNKRVISSRINAFIGGLQLRRKIAQTTRSDSRLASPSDEKKHQLGKLQMLLTDIQLSDAVPLEKLWKEARAEVLEKGRDWKITESEFTVMTEVSMEGANQSASQSASLLKKHDVRTVTTPIGHVLNQTSARVDSQHSPLSQNDCEDYRVTSVIGDEMIITAGRHSHNTTEHLHAVNAARTECFVDNRQVCSGTRHATISPYHFTQDAFAEMAPEQQQKFADDLTRPRNEATTIRTTQPQAQSENTSETTEPETRPAADTRLQTLLKEKTQKSDRNGKTETLSPAEIAALAKTDSELFALLRRQASLNRSREVFVCELTGNPELLKRAREGMPFVFNSISLLTPSPIAQFKHKLLSFFKASSRHSAAAGDELTMTEDQLQAWADLQEEIDTGKIIVDGKPVKASINTFTLGVNAVAVGVVRKKFSEFLSYLEGIVAGPMGTLFSAFKAIAPSLDDGLTGWSTVSADNEKSLRALLGDLKPNDESDADFAGGQLYAVLVQKEKAVSVAKDEEIKNQLKRDIATMKALGRQLISMWNTQSFRTNDKDAYKFVTRLNLLSSMMNAGTAFNCKSGKDRTAQLDIETKQLAFQIATTDHSLTKEVKVPEPARHRTPIELSQLATFIFYDESRRGMQKLNTGVGGSKLPEDFDSLHENYIERAAPPDQIARIKREFSGMSKLTKS